MERIKKNVVLLLLVCFASCVDQEMTPSKTQLNLGGNSISQPSVQPLVVDVEADPTQGCFTGDVEWVEEGGIVYGVIVTYEPVECPGSGGSGQVGGSTCYIAFPQNPLNGQKYVSTNACSPGAYYYSCTGSTWVIPAGQLYGTPPSNPYSGLRYMYDYTNAEGAITFIYLKNTGSAFLPDGWYIDAYTASSTKCANTSPVILGTLATSGYTFTLYRPSGTSYFSSGNVSKVTIQNSTLTVSRYSLRYVIDSTGNYYHVVGSITLSNHSLISVDNVIGSAI
ncbi:MAG: hypothetical protein ABI663_02090 [Chryseolinea sp.]